MTLAYETEPASLALDYPGGGTISFPLTGCHGEATRDLYGTEPATYYRAYWAVPRRDGLLDQALASPDLMRAVDLYGDCMTQAGHAAVTTPARSAAELDDLIADVLHGEATIRTLDLVERKLARDDAACKDSTGLSSGLTTSLTVLIRAQAADTQRQADRYAQLVSHAESVIAEQGLTR